VLIDGEFHGRPSVWQREILDALAEGVAVHGASSMGALRAAELHGFGMAGHGLIFQWYREGVIEADDEVALTYGPPELGYPPLSEPLVNIRATLAAAVPSVIFPEERDQLIGHAKALYFPERSFSGLLDAAPASRWRAERRSALASFLRQCRIDQKKSDAMTALRSVADGPQPRHGALTGVAANALWRRERLVGEGFLPSVAATDPALIARQFGITSEELRDLRHELSELFFVGLWARARGIAATREDFARARRGLSPAGDVSEARAEQLLAPRATASAAVRAFLANGGARDAAAARRAIILDWANANGIEHGGLRGDALVDWMVTQGPNQFGYLWAFGVELLDALRLQGQHAPVQTGAIP
jgi:hypothetical protein